MADSRYSTIIVNYGDADRDILTKQLRMLKERFRTFVVMVISSEEDRTFWDKNSTFFDDDLCPENMDISDAVIEYCRKRCDIKEDLYIGSKADGCDKIRKAGVEVKDTNEMAKSYKKAMEMLQKMINPLNKH